MAWRSAGDFYIGGSLGVGRVVRASSIVAPNNLCGVVRHCGWHDLGRYLALFGVGGGNYGGSRGLVGLGIF